MQQEMNTAEIGLSLGISKRTVQRLIRSGKLKAQEIAPDRYRIEESDLQALTSGHDNARPAHYSRQN
jgi:excisionase family DNA binding protein